MRIKIGTQPGISPEDREIFNKLGLDLNTIKLEGRFYTIELPKNFRVEAGEPPFSSETLPLTTQKIYLNDTLLLMITFGQAIEGYSLYFALHFNEGNIEEILKLQSTKEEKSTPQIFMG